MCVHMYVYMCVCVYMLCIVCTCVYVCVLHILFSVGIYECTHTRWSELDLFFSSLLSAFLLRLGLRLNIELISSAIGCLANELLPPISSHHPCLQC